MSAGLWRWWLSLDPELHWRRPILWSVFLLAAIFGVLALVTS